MFKARSSSCRFISWWARSPAAERQRCKSMQEPLMRPPNLCFTTFITWSQDPHTHAHCVTYKNKFICTSLKQWPRVIKPPAIRLCSFSLEVITPKTIREGSHYTWALSNHKTRYRLDENAGIVLPFIVNIFQENTRTAMKPCIQIQAQLSTQHEWWTVGWRFKDIKLKTSVQTCKLQNKQVGERWVENFCQMLIRDYATQQFSCISY